MAKAPPQRSSLRRAALLGAFLGLLGGGLMLLVLGARGLLGEVPCGDSGAEQCALEQTLAQEMGRRQLLVGVALCMLALALLYPLRAAVQAGRSASS
jgi:hypothetical protein